MRISFYNKLRLIAIICVLLLAGFQSMFPDKEFKSLERHPEPEGLINGVEVYELKNYPIVDRRVTQSEKWGGLQPIQHLSINTNWEDTSGIMGIDVSSYYSVNFKGRNGLSSVISAYHYNSNTITANQSALAKGLFSSDEGHLFQYDFHTRIMPYELKHTGFGLKAYIPPYSGVQVTFFDEFYFSGEFNGLLERLISCSITGNEKTSYCKHKVYDKEKGIRLSIGYSKSELPNWKQIEGRMFSIADAMFENNPNLYRDTASKIKDFFQYKSNGNTYYIASSNVARRSINRMGDPLLYSIYMPYTQKNTTYEIVLKNKTYDEYKKDIKKTIDREAEITYSAPRTIPYFVINEKGIPVERAQQVGDISFQKTSENGVLKIKTLSAHKDIEANWNMDLIYDEKNKYYLVCRPGVNKKNQYLHKILSEKNPFPAFKPCKYIAYLDDIDAEVSVRFQDEDKPDIEMLRAHLKKIIKRD